MWFKRKPKAQIKPSDATMHQRLMDEIRRQQLENDAEPVVSLEDFFTGNEDFGSIGCNLNLMLAPQIFYEYLKAIRSRPDVQDVLVEIRDTNEDEQYPLMWPFSDQVYILTSAPQAEVEKWLKPTQPDEVEPTHVNVRVQSIKMPEEVNTYRVWWD